MSLVGALRGYWSVLVILGIAACDPVGHIVYEFSSPDAGSSIPGITNFSIDSPTPDQNLQADRLNPIGELAGPVPIQIRLGSMDRVDIEHNGSILESLTQSKPSALIELSQEDNVSLTFNGYIGSTLYYSQKRNISVVLPSNTTCFDLLDLYELEWSHAEDSPGVNDPVQIRFPIRGVNYRYVEQTQNRSQVFLDCSLAVSLARANPSYVRRNVDTVVDLGVYNYRCIGGEGSPPNCPRGISAHASATAIDLHSFELIGGQNYVVERDWIIDSSAEETCEASTEPGGDRWLHELICEQQHTGIWNTILTPNFNAAHRNHFHVDLKDGDFIRQTQNSLFIPSDNQPKH